MAEPPQHSPEQEAVSPVARQRKAIILRDVPDLAAVLAQARESFQTPSPDSYGTIEKMELGEAKEALKNTSFYRELDPHLRKKLPQIANRATYSAGSVLFCQGDPAGNFYIVLSGQVSIFVKRERREELDISPMTSPRDNRRFARRIQSEPGPVLEPPVSPLGKRAGGSEVSSSRRARRGSSLAGLEDNNSTARRMTRCQTQRRGSIFGALHDRGASADFSPRSTPEYDEDLDLSLLKNLPSCATAEGLSTYHPGVSLGREVARLRAGQMFGELALLNSENRLGTAQCTDETEVLVIMKTDFDRILKEDMKRAMDNKIEFLREHLPGMRDVPTVRGRPHPAFFFKRATFPKGHMFLQQGIVTKSSIYVVVKGSVEIQHKEQKGEEVKVGFARSPCCQSLRPPTSSCGHKMSRLGDDLLGHFTGSGKALLGRKSESPEKVEIKLGELVAGGAFGSLSCICSEAEPFDVVAARGPVEVLHITGPQVAKLPQRLLNSFRNFMRNMMVWHLEQLAEHLLRCNLQKAESEAERQLQRMHSLPIWRLQATEKPPKLASTVGVVRTTNSPEPCPSSAAGVVRATTTTPPSPSSAARSAGTAASTEPRPASIPGAAKMANATKPSSAPQLGAVRSMNSTEPRPASTAGVVHMKNPTGRRPVSSGAQLMQSKTYHDIHRFLWVEGKPKKASAVARTVYSKHPTLLGASINGSATKMSRSDGQNEPLLAMGSSPSAAVRQRAE